MIDNKARIARLKPEEYQSILGVKKPTFEKMLELLEAKHAEKKKRGRPEKVSILDRLVIALDYWHDYRPMRRIAFDYDISKSLVQSYIVWVEDILIKSGEFALPSKRVLGQESDIETVIVDVTEHEIERPKKKSKEVVFGEEKETYD